MANIHQKLHEITEDIIKRSNKSRSYYLQRMEKLFGTKVKRSEINCTNYAHAIASSTGKTRIILQQKNTPNIAIINSYNDVISAHHPYQFYPKKIKEVLETLGATAQVAGGVPAMCDGVTQGQVGMELSLFSRDVIALATSVSLVHNVFDGIICLGICDKIVPGLLMGSLSFGYLPTIFIPSGPMTTSSISNTEKTNIRKLYVEHKISTEELLKAEMKSYHSAGTCTFYGTANSNQMLMEIMGLHIPGSAFINPNTKLRDELTNFATQKILDLTKEGQNFTPLCNIISEKTIVNAIVGLIATGGSTNHTMHIPAIARVAGIIVTWEDFAKISEIVPLIARVYPNGEKDVNQFHQAGGIAYVISQLLEAGLLHNDVNTVMGNGLQHYTKNPYLDENDELNWHNAKNNDDSILRPINNPFSSQGGLKLLKGNLGKAVTKISAVKKDHHYIKAPAKVFCSQEEVINAYNNNELNCDCIVVLCYQGAQANGMPELHGLTPILASIQDKGFNIGLVTDGRLSGASGKIPNAIHLYPETLANGNIAKIKNGDIIILDIQNGILNVEVSDTELQNRSPIIFDISSNKINFGRELFHNFRQVVTTPEEGASAII